MPVYFDCYNPATCVRVGQVCVVQNGNLFAHTDHSSSLREGRGPYLVDFHEAIHPQLASCVAKFGLSEDHDVWFLLVVWLAGSYIYL